MLRPIQPSQASFQPGRHGLKIKVGELIRRAPVAVTAVDTIARGMQAMADEHVGSVIVLTPDKRHPIGIVTLQDILCRVALPRVDIGQAISVVMTPDPVTVAKDTTALQASLLMAQRNLRHLLVTDEQACLVGVISKNDLYDLLCLTCSAVTKAK